MKSSETNILSVSKRVEDTLTEREYIAGCLSNVECNGIMGVPITFLDKYNPEQFEIIGLDRYTVPKELLVGGRLAVKGNTKYARILIRRKSDENTAN